jgi:hypothetical protein
MLRITAVSAGAVDHLIRGSGCTDHDHDHDHDRSDGRKRGAVAGYDGAAASVGHGGRGGAVGDAAGYMGAAVRSGRRRVAGWVPAWPWWGWIGRGRRGRWRCPLVMAR